MLKYFIYLLLLFNPLSTYALNNIPHAFPDKKTALQYGCKMEYLKEKGKENLILTSFDNHDLVISIYDSHSNGGFSNTEQLKITSWYKMAKVDYKDLLGNGVPFIQILSEGNTGTGTLQKILIYIGWHENHFAPVLMETISYYETLHPDFSKLIANYHARNIGTDKVTFDFHYSFSKRNLALEKIDIQSKWNDSLKWNGNSFSFYNNDSESSKRKKSIISIQENISKVRLNILNNLPKPSNLDIDTLNNIEITKILDLVQ